MAQYAYTKPGIAKPQAFEAYLKQNFAFYKDFTYTDPDLIIDTTVVLNVTEQQNLQTLVNNYTDPAVFLVLDTTTTDACMSKTTSSATPENVLSFIFSPNNPVGSSTFDSLKTVLEYSTTDISLFATGSTDCTVTFQIFDYTRNAQITLNTFDISDVLLSWKTLSGTTSGPAYVLRSFMVQGLRNLISNYDCIWQFRISVSNPNVSVRSNSMQRLYYNLI